MGIRTLSLLLLLPCAAHAGDLPGVPERRHLAASVYGGGGISLPFGGHWGDASSGFKPSSSFLLGAVRHNGGVVGTGIEVSYAPRHEFRPDGHRRLGLSSASLVARSGLPCGAFDCHALFGAGGYYWDQPGFASGGIYHGGDSGLSFGISFGYGVYKALGLASVGAELRLRHIFGLKGRDMDLDDANNMDLYLTLSLPLWKGRG